MVKLLGLEEMEERHKEGEDPFVIVILSIGSLSFAILPCLATSTSSLQILSGGSA